MRAFRSYAIAPVASCGSPPLHMMNSGQAGIGLSHK